jgi:hypothetical protein
LENFELKEQKVLFAKDLYSCISSGIEKVVGAENAVGTNCKGSWCF